MFDPPAADGGTCADEAAQAPPARAGPVPSTGGVPAGTSGARWAQRRRAGPRAPEGRPWLGGGSAAPCAATPRRHVLHVRAAPPWPPSGPAARPARRSRLRGAPAWGGSPACVAAGSSGATPAGSVQRACRRCNGSPPAAAPPGPRHPSPSGRQCESGSPPAGRRPAPPRPAPRSSATAGSAGSPSPPRWRWWRPSPPPSPTLSPPPSPTLSPAGSAAPGSPIP